MEKILNQSTDYGWVALVGAGSGDPELITVKGMRLINECDALVYDNLMADEFVAFSLAKEKIFVGKSAGKHSMPQEKINQLLVDLAKQGKNVVRLKGGDPFVFGRGGEECQALKNAGVSYVVVPGVTAAVAGTAYAGIPVTHRERSRGVTLLTGHFAKDRKVDLPWDALAGLGHTLVFYMAVASIGHISKSLIKSGMNQETPAAVIERATTGSQREVVATVETIGDKVKENGIRPPSILIIGDVVGLESELKWQKEHPLAGKGIIFTRASESQYDSVHKLRELGAEVLDVPVVGAIPRRNDKEVRKAISLLDEIECIAFTSALAVNYFFEELIRHGTDMRSLANHTIAAGSKTVIQALVDKGVTPDLAPQAGEIGKLPDLISKTGLSKGAKVLLPRSSAADEGLPNKLKKLGFSPYTVSMYDAVPLDLSWLDVKLNNWNPDAVVFLSGSGVKALLESAPKLRDINPTWSCIGAKTAKSLEKLGIKAEIIPERPDVGLLVDEVIEKLQS